MGVSYRLFSKTFDCGQIKLSSIFAFTFSYSYLYMVNSEDKRDDRIMGCFEDYMQFRDEVDEVKKKIHRQGTNSRCGRREDRAVNEKTSASPKPKIEES